MVDWGGRDLLVGVGGLLAQSTRGLTKVGSIAKKRGGGYVENKPYEEIRVIASEGGLVAGPLPEWETHK